MRRRAGPGRFLALALVLGLLAVLGPATSASRPSDSPVTLTATSPAPGETITTQTPNITATFSDSAGVIRPDHVVMIVDGLNVTGLDTTTITADSINYEVAGLLKLREGNHTVLVAVGDDIGNHASVSWGFNVTIGPPPIHPVVAVKPGTLILYVALGAGAVAAGILGYILYLKQAKRFTFRKYFATHPVKREYLVLYIPGAIAVAFILLGLVYVYNSPEISAVAPDYVIIVGMFIGLTLYALDARREKLRMRSFERAFAQFLFEMADAMRGGIDPAKAVVELAKTTTNILRKPLRIAADGIRMGRPFDSILRTMVAPMRSGLITRYAGLVADASSTGGETAAVVYRAAKDMDDFVKIEVERSKQLVMPVAVLYIAFSVLMAVLFALLYIAPSLGTINVSIFAPGSSPLSGAGAASTGGAHLSPLTLRERFYDLMVINALGTGVIIGAFTEGRARYGLVHSLALVAVTTIAFAILFPA